MMSHVPLARSASHFSSRRYLTIFGFMVVVAFTGTALGASTYLLNTTLRSKGTPFPTNPPWNTWNPWNAYNEGDSRGDVEIWADDTDGLNPVKFDMLLGGSAQGYDGKIITPNESLFGYEISDGSYFGGWTYYAWGTVQVEISGLKGNTEYVLGGSFRGTNEAGSMEITAVGSNTVVLTHPVGNGIAYLDPVMSTESGNVTVDFLQASGTRFDVGIQVLGLQEVEGLVPEPSGFLTLALGLLGLGVYAWRRVRRAK